MVKLKEGSFHFTMAATMNYTCSVFQMPGNYLQRGLVMRRRPEVVRSGEAGTVSPPGVTPKFFTQVSDF